MLNERLQQDIKDDIWEFTSKDIWELSNQEIDSFIDRQYDGNIPKPFVKKWLYRTREDNTVWIVSGSEGIIAVFVNKVDAVNFVEQNANATQYEPAHYENVHEYI